MASQQGFSGSPAQGLWGATVGFFTGFAAVALFGPTANMFREAMQLDPGTVGWLVAMPALSGSILRIPFSAWVDTTGGRKPFLVLLLLSLAGMAGLLALILTRYPDDLTPSLFPLVALLGVLCGCGIATFSVGISQVSYWFPAARQGSALGTYAGVGNLAPGIFSFLLPLALAGFGLAGAYLAWLCFLALGTFLYFRMGRNAWYFQLREKGVDPAQAREQARRAGQEFFPAGSTVTSLVTSARIWKTWCLVGIYFTTFGGFIALTAWLPTYWSRYFELSLVSAGALTALYSILTSLARVAGGRVADQMGGERTMLISLGAMLLGAVWMSLARSPESAVAAELLLACGMGVANAAVFKLVPQAVPKAVGGAAGWVGGLGAFGGFAIPPLMGHAVSRWGHSGYAYGFLTFVALALVALLLTAVLTRTWGVVRQPESGVN
jgi:NNP family nitrate/nitrite transporter-like MFS transporter